VDTVDPKNVERDVWRRISSLFTEALDLPAPEREGFLGAACDGDNTLRREIERLLGEYECAGSFLEAQALGPPALPDADEAVFQAGDLLAGRFLVVRLLGAGGMGEVYEAVDQELRQNIAIKTLHAAYAREPKMAQRFRVEVLRSRQITHPNVARVHDLFTHRTAAGDEIPFFTMELLSGETLSHRLIAEGPFPPAAALPLLKQMASALDAAHRAGVVHRDFKPGNTFLLREPDGSVVAKVADFGIAGELGDRAVADDSAEGDADATFIAGTPAYMAPEQLNGEPSTAAADVYALGLVAYEVLTGRRAFESSSPIVCLLRKNAPGDPKLCEARADIPPRWAAAIDRAVQWDPSRRFENPLELIAAVEGKRFSRARKTAAAAIALLLLPAALWFARFGLAPKPEPTSIAVLPFAGGRNEAYLGEGVADGLIRTLANYPNVRVSPLNAAAEYQKRKVPLRRIADNLGAAMLVTGSLRQTGHRLHLTAEFIDGVSGKQVWSKSYDCDLQQFLSVQRDIEQRVVSRLGLRRPSSSSARPATSNAAAYDLFMRGRYLGNMRNREGLAKSIEYFNQAIGLDAGFATAHTAIAESYEMLFEYGWMPSRDAAPKVRAALKTALALDPENPQTQAVLGLFNHRLEWNQVEAERAFMRALSRDPNLAEAHHWYAAMLWRAGRFDEALREAQEARHLDPVTLPTLLGLAWVRYGRREYREAIDICKQALELNPSYSSAYQLMAQSYAAAGETAAALSASAETQRLDTDPEVALRHRALVLSRLHGYEAEARRVAGELERLSPDRQTGYLARIYGGLGDRERMYLWADRAVGTHDSGLLEAKVDPALDRFRSETHFQEIVGALGFR
jgi:eukaryotic-like serine/threonine-protein kinase